MLVASSLGVTIQKRQSICSCFSQDAKCRALVAQSFAPFAKFCDSCPYAVIPNLFTLFVNSVRDLLLPLLPLSGLTLSS